MIRPSITELIAGVLGVMPSFVRKLEPWGSGLLKKTVTGTTERGVSEGIWDKGHLAALLSRGWALEDVIVVDIGAVSGFAF